MSDNTDNKSDRQAAVRWGLPRRPGSPAAVASKGPSAHAVIEPDGPAKHTSSIAAEPQIICPHCRGEIKLTQTLAAPLIAETRRQFEQQLAAKESDFQSRETMLRDAQDALTRRSDAISEEIENRLKAEKAVLVEVEAAKARQALAEEIAGRDRQLDELRQLIEGKDEKLAQAQAAQAEALRKQRDLDEARRELDLTVERRVQDALGAVRERAKLEVEDGLKKRLSEKEAQIASMQNQIEHLLRKAEQGSQQLQGEALEIELEAQLRARFPNDLIEPVPKGEFGGDVLQRVVGVTGRTCGTILWESKRTKNWSDGWLAKLRGDQRAAGADFAMIVSSALPKDVETFDFVQNIWIVQPRYAVPLAIALRQSLVDIAATRVAQEGQQTKMHLVYEYLTGPRFRHRVEAIVEQFTDMQSDLDRERKAMTRLWAKREEQLRVVLGATAGLYGDLQGIAGRAMQEIEGLNVLSIEAPDNLGP